MKKSKSNNNEQLYRDLIKKNNLSEKKLKIYEIIWKIFSVIFIFLGLIVLLYSIAGLFIILFGVFFIKLAKFYKNARITCFNNTQTTEPSIIENAPTNINTFSSDKTSLNLQPIEKQPILKTFKPLDSIMFGCVKKYEYNEVKYYIPDDVTHIQLNINDFISFKQEPENIYDELAVALYKDNTKIGYLNKGKLQDMVNDYLSHDNNYYIVIGKSDTPTTVCIAFYKHVSLLTNEYSMKTYSLTGLNKKDFMNVKRSENLDLLSEGDDVTLEYDFSSEKYIVYTDTGSEIGELSTSISEKLFKNGLGDYISIISEIIRDSEGQVSTCKIELYTHI